MKSQEMKTVFWALGMLLSVGCGDNEALTGPEPLMGEGMDDANEDVEPDSDRSDDAEAFVKDNDEETVPVLMMWEESVKTTSESVDGLRLTLTNRTGVDLDVTVTLHFAGMIKMTADLKRDTQRLPAFGTSTVFIAASEIPIQTASGASSVTAALAVQGGSGAPEMLLSSSEVFYRHSKDFNNLISFDMTYLVDTLGGDLTPVTPAALSSAKGIAGIAAPVLGRIKHAEGFKDITLSASDFVDVVDGEIMGRELGSSVSFDIEE